MSSSAADSTHPGSPDQPSTDPSEIAAAPTPRHGSYPPGQDPARWRILGVLLTAIFMSLISVSIVNVALPSIQHSLGTDNSSVQWVLSGYALTFGIVLVAAGRAGDLLGRGGMFLIGLSVYTLSSVGAGLAPTPEALNIARFIQGVGAGLLNPQGVGMMQQYFRGAERGRAFGFFGSTVGIAVAIGPVLGGFLIKIGGPDLGWRFTMLVNVPFAILAFVLGWLWFPRPLLRRVRNANTGSVIGPLATLRVLDPIGAVLLGLSVLSILLPFVEHTATTWIWLCFPFGLLLLTGWVSWERHHLRAGHPPMVDLRIFRVASFRNGALLAALWFMGITSIWVLVAIYFQTGLQHSALVAGSVGIPAALLSSITANWAGKKVSTHGRLVVIGGMVMVIAGLAVTLLLIWLHYRLGISEWWMVVSLACVGAGQGSVVSPNQTLTLAEVPLNYAGSSGAVLQTGQRIGTSIGLAIITALVFAVEKSTNWSLAIVVGFTAIIIVCLCSLSIGFIDYRRQRDRPRRPARRMRLPRSAS